MAKMHNVAKKINKVTPLPPPWMQGARTINDQEMLVVHMNNGELEGLDNLQGGPSIDPLTGIREYSALGPIIELPEIQEIFHHVTNEIEKHGKLSPDLHKIYEDTKKHSLPYREAPDEKHDPLKRMEKTGLDGDTKLALIPLNLAFFLIELKHVPTINPKTGLLAFGFFKSVGKFFRNIVRIAGTVGGAVLGGPLGAGLGRAAAGLLTGQKLGDSLRSGISHAGRAGIISGLGGAVSHFAPGLSSTIGNVATNALGPTISSAAGNFFTGPSSTMGLLGKAGNALGIGNAAGTTAGLTAAQAIPGVTGTAPATTGAVTAIAPGATGGSSLLGGLVKLAPLGMAGLTYMANKQRHKNEMKMYKENQAINERYRNEMGFAKNWEAPSPREQLVNEEFMNITPEEMRAGRYIAPYLDSGPKYAKGGLVRSYSKGTLVRGAGKGQDDKIKTSVPEGAYIIDASSTSMFGDGSSTAGAKVLKDFENQIKKRFPKHFHTRIEGFLESKTGQVPVWLSDSEYKFDPMTVTMLGDGSNTKGAAILKKMVINLRKHKISKGDELPPKAKHPLAYISKGRR